MNANEYSKAVLKTESKPEVVAFGTMATHAMLGVVYLTGELVDKAKKKMFYGKPFSNDEFIQQAEELQGLLEHLKTCAEDGSLTDPGDIAEFDLPPHLEGLSLHHIDKRLLHVVLGVSSETSELADALRQAWEAQTEVDRINLGEEIGDCLWYLAVGSDAIGIPLEVLFEQNITKLNDKKTGRYKQGSFNVQEAIIRNTEAERVLLEQSLQAKTGQTYVAGLGLGVQEADARQLIPTGNSQVFYEPATYEFVVFNEHCVEASRNGSYREAIESLVDRKITAQAVTDSSLTKKLKTYGARALDAADAGIDRAKDFLKK